MSLSVEYTGQLAEAAGCTAETVDLGAGPTLGDVLKHLESAHSDEFSHLVFDGQGNLRSTLLVALDDVMISGDKATVELSGVSVVLFMMPVAGG